MRKLLVAAVAAGALALDAVSLALAKQPCPLDYHTFDLSGGS
jgi:hypothetical protein